MAHGRGKPRIKDPPESPLKVSSELFIEQPRDIAEDLRRSVIKSVVAESTNIGVDCTFALDIG